MISIIDKKSCCGCGACKQICPAQAIAMVEDSEGFLYPEVNKELCVNCNLCDKVCPVNCELSFPPILKGAYAAKNRDLTERMNSSSGGLFILFAQKVIEQGGVVFGAVFDEKFEVHHTFAENIDEVRQMMKSKYVQSRIENCYIEAEKFLKLNRIVLFTGTSCQIRGLHTFLGKKYKNLLAVDVICHGVPSPKVWRQYLKEFKAKEGFSHIDNINFREKEKSYKSCRLHVSGCSNERAAEKKEYYGKLYEDPYIKGFLADIYLRPACHDCCAKGGKSGSDLTIADFWGIEKVLPELDDDKGTSLLLVNSACGKEFVNQLDFEKDEVPFESGIKNNESFYISVKPHPKRNKFFKGFEKGKTIESMVIPFTKLPLKVRILWRLKKYTKVFFK